MLRSKFLACAAAFLANPTSPKSHFFATTTDSIANLERAAGARIGLATLDSSGSLIIGHRSRERFPLASTQKLPLVMTVLARKTCR
jgi:beta-lactamase class A